MINSFTDDSRNNETNYRNNEKYFRINETIFQKINTYPEI